MGLGGFLGQLKELGGAVAENVGKHIEFRVNQENSASSADGYKNSNISERNQLEVYKTLEPGKEVHGGDWVGHDAAEEEIVASYKRYQDSH